MQAETTLRAQAGRECSCPPWVIRCAHFPDGQVMYVHQGYRPHGLFFVCMRGLERLDGGYWCGTDVAIAETEAEALRAFYDAEERLLRGDA